MSSNGVKDSGQIGKLNDLAAQDVVVFGIRTMPAD
tara:strand:+ start:186 stop:290 length:105 start_codon:yes stop_codon:yes gene_type:complete